MGVLLSFYDFPGFWCMGKVDYVGVVVDKYICAGEDICVLG